MYTLGRPEAELFNDRHRLDTLLQLKKSAPTSAGAGFRLRRRHRRPGVLKRSGQHAQDTRANARVDRLNRCSDAHELKLQVFHLIP